MVDALSMFSIYSPEYVCMVLVSIFISKTHNHFWSATGALRIVRTMYICTNLRLQHSVLALWHQDRNQSQGLRLQIWVTWAVKIAITICITIVT